ncbi:unnamed protein product [Meganyctiphanes norvegica]|uniref:C2H2-type domain-containing protein n=1 Tax=Meganyctiphanes norvegica TaxID=48144 RepID=A0AAV2RPE3_MEGNR
MNNSNIVEIKCNENGNKPEGGSHLHKVLQNSTYGSFEVKINEDIEGSEELGQIEDDEINVKEELEIKEEPINFTAGIYQCSQYEQEYPQNSHKCSLIHHQTTHTGEKPHQCRQCDKAFSRKSDLIQHHTTHTREKPYKCSQCAEAFSRKGNLIEHQRTHSGEKPYQRTQCDKAFSQNSNLINHQRIHSGEKPYQCSQCDKAFSLNSSLIIHQRTHTG